MSKILVIAEHADGKLSAAVAKTVSAATAIGGEVHLAVFAVDGAAVGAEAAKIAGVGKVLTVNNPANEHALAATLAPQVVELAKGYSHVLFPGTTFGKDLAPRVAAKLDVQQVSDIMAVHSPTSFDRPIYAGNAITTVEVPAEPLILATVRLASFQAAAQDGSAPVEAASVYATLPTQTRVLKHEAQ